MKEWIEKLKKCGNYHKKTKAYHCLGKICCIKLIAEIEKSEDVIEKAEKVCKQWFEWTGRYDNKMDLIKFIDLMLKLKQALDELRKNDR